MSEPRAQHGYLLLADISGYTSYVAATEIEHSQAVLSELLEIIVAHLTPALTLAKLEGDAVFVYAPERAVASADSLFDVMESTYVAFRDGVEASRRRTTCQCNACRAIPTLDLKFVAHHGEFFIQSVASTRELLGSDVNLIHRLLKNHVSELTGWRAYLLLTDAFWQHLLARPAQPFECSEQYEHLGTVQLYAMDLRSRYDEIVEARHVYVPREAADFVSVVDLAAPPLVVWEWLNDPVKRSQWYSEIRPITRPGGRLKVGAVNHCVHGKAVEWIETIVDWRPFDYFTAEQVNVSKPMVFTYTSQLTPQPNGTRLSTYGQMRYAGAMRLLKPLSSLMLKQAGIHQRYERLAQTLNSGSTQELQDGKTGNHAAHSGHDVRELREHD